MTGIAAAASIAAVNTVAQFGGLIGPWLIGLVKNSTGSFTLALVIVACFLLVAATIAATMRVTAKAPATGVHRLPGDGEIANPASPPARTCDDAGAFRLAFMTRLQCIHVIVVECGCRTTGQHITQE